MRKEQKSKKRGKLQKLLKKTIKLYSILLEVLISIKLRIIEPSGEELYHFFTQKGVKR